MEKVVLIHGSLGSSLEFKEIKKYLCKKFEVFLYDIPHHGEKAHSTLPFTIESLTDDLLNFLQNIGPVYVYGFSFGGYLALSAATKNEAHFKGIITQGTKFEWSPKVAKDNIQALLKTPQSKGEMVFEKHLQTIHGSYLPELKEKSIAALKELGNHPFLNKEKLSKLKVPVRMTRGAKDPVSNREETLQFSEYIIKAHYFEIPKMIHPIGFIAPKHIARHIEIQLNSFTYQWVSTSYGKVAYQKIGEIENKETPLLLFLHEAIGSIAQWKDFPAHLCKALNLPGLVIELPGYGFSDDEDKTRDARYLHEFGQEYIPHIVEQLEIKNPLLLIGHSDGGTNALFFAAKYPEKIQKIVTMAAHYINEEVTRQGIQPAIEAYQQGKLDGLYFFHGEKTEHLFYNWSKTWLRPDFKDWDISDAIRNCTVPALILQGDKDQYGTNQQVLGIVGLLQNAQALFIKDCGHAPHLEKEKEVIDAIVKFINS